MPNILLRPDWALPERCITPEVVYRNRRQFLKQMGFVGAGLLAGPLTGCSHSPEGGGSPATTSGATSVAKSRYPKKYPAPRNPDFNPKEPVTPERIVATYNNFYEFSTEKDEVCKRVGRFVTAPWPITISGLVNQPLTLDAEELVGQMPLEERVYRLRCVEAWAAVIPWTGFPLSKLIARVKPRAEARFIRFVSFNRPDQAPGMRELPNYPWPYFEGLRMDEALNPLTLVVTGMYGKPLLKQDGAPVRIIVPWKYGYKSIKSIVSLEFIAKQPKTFWETLWPEAYPFQSNVDPTVPHPRWSQATERVLGTGDRVKTRLYNGYSKYVAQLYSRT